MKPAAKLDCAAPHSGLFPGVPVFGMVRQGTESYFAAQWILLDLAVHQNGIAMNTLRGRFTAQPSPAVTMAELTRQGVEGSATAQ